MIRYTTLFIGTLAVLASLVSPAPAAAEAYRHKRLLTDRVVHDPVAEEDCTVCHAMHFPVSGTSLGQAVPELCFECHDPFSGASTHTPVRAGQCLSCHYPHSSATDGLLSAAVPGLCLDCHRDKRQGQHRQALYTGLCTRCHDPHASTAPNLITPSAQEDCGSCHPDRDGGEFVHTAVREYDCQECHDPHNRPPTEILGCRECHDDVLAGENLHPPLEDGCWDCHGTHGGPLENQLLSAMPDLCVDCHDDKENGLHGRITLETACTLCHDPHSSERRSLLNRRAARAPCASCHVTVISRPVKHTPVENGRCERCHDPHGPQPVAATTCDACHRELLVGKYVHEPAADGCDSCHDTHSGYHDDQLLTPLPQLCLDCHDEKEGGRHKAIMLDEDCVRCHNPHSSPQPAMLTIVQQSDGCESCHTSVSRRPKLHTPLAEYSCDECHDPHSDKAGEAVGCADCHDDLLAGAVVHEPARDCGNCHDSHSGVRDDLLLSEHPDLCVECHEDKAEGMHNRTRMSMSCISCHDPHSSAREGLVEAFGDRRCQSCHQDKENQDYTHGALSLYECRDCHDPHSEPPEMPPISCHQCHEALRDRSPRHSSDFRTRCLECHDPHGSPNPNMLIDRTAMSETACVECHREIARKLEHSRVIHEPAQGGACGSCHTSHSGDRPYTVLQFEDAKNVPYDQAAYALCFSCHESTLVQIRYAATETGFRNGPENLHYIHVVRDGEKGFSCWVCHDMHASRQPYLLNRENPYNRAYNLKVHFRELENGGECRTNCHTMREYRR